MLYSDIGSDMVAMAYIGHTTFSMRHHGNLPRRPLPVVTFFDNKINVPVI